MLNTTNSAAGTSLHMATSGRAVGRVSGLMICTLAGLTLAGGPAWAQTQGVTIAGTLDLGMRRVSNGALGHMSTEVSGANATSKLVIRGSEDLGEGLSASFFLDSTLLADTGSSNTPLWDRRSTLSLTHTRWGELRLGRDFVPTHLVWSGIDPFTTLGVASANTFRSVGGTRALGQAFGTTAEAGAQNPTLRVNNTAQYFLPGGLGGVYGAVMLAKGENGSAAAGATSGLGGRLGWQGAGLNVALAQFRTRNANADQPFTDRAWGLAYDFGPLRASVGQRRWHYGADTATNTLLGLTMPLGRSGTLKLSYVRADQQGATAASSANDANLFGLGYVHSLSRRTALYAHWARLGNQGEAAYSIAGGPAVSASPTAANYFGGQTSKALELGVRHDF